PSFKNHYGGQLAFGQDGFLYAATGDGGGSGDPSNNAQNRQSLLGKLLRLDVESPGVTTYRIPGNNPFVGDRDPQNLTRDEIWAVGLRNPWRFSFDRQTGNFYLADVGQDRVEEINFQAASDLGGQNYGWNVLEGTLPYPDASRSVMTNGFTAPVFQYSHDQSRSVTGGYVYRGTSIPGLEGTYVYGDFASGVLWGLRQTSTGRWQNQLLIDSPYRISTFGQDEQGSLYATDFFGNAETNGVVYRLELA
nr:PQQ-dependent sugar dehydrogenase [Oculatellaceae cyanobacterium Prado106]